MLRELARPLGLDDDTRLAWADAADTMVRESLEAYPERTAAVIKRFRVAQPREFMDWEGRRSIIEKRGKRGRSLSGIRGEGSAHETASDVSNTI